MTFTPLHTLEQGLAIELKNELIEIINGASKNSPRSKQKFIGPSELATPCTRKLAYKLLDWDKVNESGGGSWAANVGTAIHSYLEDIFSKYPERFETETRVKVRDGLSGTIDLFHLGKNMVLDWKTKQPAGVKEKAKEGASHQEIVQTMAYAKGKINEGQQVDYVGLIYLPTGGQISDMYVELHKYDEAIVDKALARIDDLYTLLSTVDVETNPAMWPLIPSEPSRMCMYCPYYRPYSNDLSIACNGETEPKNV